MGCLRLLFSGVLLFGVLFLAPLARAGGEPMEKYLRYLEKPRTHGDLLGFFRGVWAERKTLDPFLTSLVLGDILNRVEYGAMGDTTVHKKINDQLPEDYEGPTIEEIEKGADAVEAFLRRPLSEIGEREAAVALGALAHWRNLYIEKKKRQRRFDLPPPPVFFDFAAFPRLNDALEDGGDAPPFPRRTLRDYALFKKHQLLVDKRVSRGRSLSDEWTAVNRLLEHTDPASFPLH